MLPGMASNQSPYAGYTELPMQQVMAGAHMLQTMQPAQGRYTGRVKSFSATNGFGFLTSPEVTAAFGQDVFVHQLEVDKITGMPKSPLPCGATVSFTVVPNKRGQPQARELQMSAQFGMDSMMLGTSNAAMAAMQYAMMGGGAQNGEAQFNQAQTFQYDPATMPIPQIPGYGTYCAGNLKAPLAASANTVSVRRNTATTVTTSVENYPTYVNPNAPVMNMRNGGFEDLQQIEKMEKFKRFANESTRSRSRSPR